MAAFALVYGGAAFLVAAWAIFSHKVKDGILIKHLLILLALAGFAFAVRPGVTSFVVITLSALVLAEYFGIVRVQRIAERIKRL